MKIQVTREELFILLQHIPAAKLQVAIELLEEGKVEEAEEVLNEPEKEKN